MGESVSGIRESFYSDIIYDYQCRYEGKREKSFLYRAFWADSVSGMLKRLDRSLSEHVAGHGTGHDAAHGTGHGTKASTPLEDYMAPVCQNSRPGSWDYPWLLAKHPLKPTDQAHIKEQLAAAMKEHPAWARGLLIKEVPEKGRKERRDFWEELWLRDAAYLAGLVTDTEYYFWLVEYLAVRDIYYKDNSIADAHLWLRGLLLRTGVAGIQNTGNGNAAENVENAENPENRQKGKDSEDLNVKANVEKKLAEAARLIRQERDTGGTKIAARLHDLKCSKTRNGMVIRMDYLPWLTARLERMALHIKIKTWLQDSGYPLGGRGKADKSSREPRKQDFSLRLFEAYCDSEEGYDFYRKDLSSQENCGGWHMDSQGFCVLGLSQAEKLRESLERSGGRYLYIPLAMHLGSGCIFFLAGKENYREAYEDAEPELKTAYQEAKVRYCFDYLRLDEKYQARFPGDVGGAFRLQPTFHENQGKSCLDVLRDFKRYCLTGTDSPRRAVKILNEESPNHIPDEFRWAFDDLEEMEVSPQAAASFQRAREMAEKTY